MLKQFFEKFGQFVFLKLMQSDPELHQELLVEFVLKHIQSEGGEASIELWEHLGFIPGNPLGLGPVFPRPFRKRVARKKVVRKPVKVAKRKPLKKKVAKKKTK